MEFGLLTNFCKILAFDRFSIFILLILSISALLPFFTTLYCLQFLTLVLGDTTSDYLLVVLSIEVSRPIYLLMTFL